MRNRTNHNVYKMEVGEVDKSGALVCLPFLRVVFRVVIAGTMARQPNVIYQRKSGSWQTNW